MKALFVLLLPCLAFGQMHAKHESYNLKKVEYSCAGLVSHFDLTQKGKTENITAIDGEFSALLSQSRFKKADTLKSVSVAFDKAKAKKEKIKLKKNSSQINGDPEKENRSSAISIMIAAIKAGYKKDKPKSFVTRVANR